MVILHINQSYSEILIIEIQHLFKPRPFMMYNLFHIFLNILEDSA